MTTVTIQPTPEAVPAKTVKTTDTVTDELGRVIGVKKLGPVDRMRFFKMLGPDLSRNEAYVGHAFLAYVVTSIDSDPVVRPTSELQLEALIQRLGDEGIAAVAQCPLLLEAASFDRDAVKN